VPVSQPRPARALGGSGATALAWLGLLLLLLWPSVSQAGDFIDTRLTFNLTDENLLVKPGETNPSVPGVRLGAPNSLGILFFDNYDTRFNGYENLTHLTLYKRVIFGHFDVEGAFLIRMNAFTDVNISLSDAGSYIKVSYFFDESRTNKTNLSLVAFPLSSDRMRLGYSWRISWGGSPVFYKFNPDVPSGASAFVQNTAPAPGAKLQIANEDFYAYVGAKTSILLNPKSNEQETVYGILGGAGVHLGRYLLAEAYGAYFDRGKNPKQEVLGEPVRLAGVGGQVTLHDGIAPGASLDYALYKNDPTSAARYFAREKYPGGFAWLISSEGNFLLQTLQDADTPASTKIQTAFAVDLNVRLKYNFWRFKLDALVRDLAYILNNVPSFVPFQDFSKAVTTSPELFAAVGFDRHIPIGTSGLTIGATVGVQKPATYATAGVLPTPIIGNNPTPGSLSQTGGTTVVVRNEGDFSILPPGQGSVPIIAGKLVTRLDFAEFFAAQLEILISHDENQTRLERGANDLPFRIFSQANQLGFNLSLSARY
jgi:hypothetical protein